MTYTIDFQPIGKRIAVNKEMHILAAAQDAGIALTAVCGGVGACLLCKVQCMTGDLSDVQLVERDAFSDLELAQGWRLACQAYPRSDLKINIPPESMTTAQRLQIDGNLRDVTLAPLVKREMFSLTPPDLHDLRADWERFKEDFQSEISVEQRIDLPVLNQLSDRIRALNWTGNVVMGEDQRVVGILAQDQPFYGLAVDIGTTKMAAFLVDLTTGETVSKMGTMNPQIAFGEDVISRIAYANQGYSFRTTLQRKLVDSLNEIIREMCTELGLEASQIVDFVVVGNTAMHHLFSGLSVRQLGQAPYVPAVKQAIQFFAHEIGLLGAPGSHVYMPPNVAGYVGADHVAMLLASDLQAKEGVSLALDIGTNTEISLSKGDQLLSCSCASGPAFEGAHIHAGMRASPGAIERVQFYDGEWHIATIDDKPAVGICGSGILDVVAVLLETGQIDAAGRFTDRAIRRIDYEKGGAIVLVPANESGTGKDILVTRGDIREIQLAKAAIRAGVDALLRATSTDSVVLI